MVFVTGGTGLLGSHLLYNLCLNNYAVVGLRRPAGDITKVLKTFELYTSKEIALQYFSKIKWVEGDILDPHFISEMLIGITYVFHCAAVVSYDPEAKAAIYTTNVEGTSNIVNCAIGNPSIKKLCFVSSIATLGFQPNLITEEAAWKNDENKSNYAISKYAAEKEIWRAAEEGLPIVIVNPSVIIGPGNWDMGSPALIRTAFGGLKFYTEGITGFVDVRDVANIMVKLTESGVTNEKFIVSAGNISYKQFFCIAQDFFGKPRPSIKTSPLLSSIYWRIGRLKYILGISKQPVVTKETAESAHEQRHYSNQKIIDFLNYKFIPIEDSIKFTCSVFLRDLQEI